MAHYAGESVIAKLAANAVEATYSPYSEDMVSLGRVKGAYSTAKKIAPFQPGHIVFAQLDGGTKRVLVYDVEPEWAERLGCFVPHICGFVERKNGQWARMFRHIKFGDIFRGYMAAGKVPSEYLADV